jgi:hypothetical protein
VGALAAVSPGWFNGGVDNERSRSYCDREG